MASRALGCVLSMAGIVVVVFACGGGSEGAATSDCDTTSKTCQAGLADGAPCTRSEQCTSGRCLNGKREASSRGSELSLAFLCGG